MPTASQSTAVQGRLRRLSMRAFRWISSTRDEVPPEVRLRMQATMLDRKTAPLVASLGAAGIAAMAIWTTGATWPFFWIAADLALSMIRVAVLIASERAIDRGEPGHLDIAAWLGLGYVLVLSVGSSVCITSGQPVLAVLAIGNLAGVLGNVTTRNATVPRFGIAVMVLLTILPCVAMTQSPFEGMAIAAIQPLFALAGMIYVMLENNRLATRMFMAEHENRLLAMTDPLTALPNRLALEETLSSLDERLRDMPADAGFALLSIDLDGFKSVNDNFGHPAGDLLLKSVARRLLHAVRPEDRVYRLGGDEFLIVLQQAKAAEAAFIAKRIITAIARPFDLGEGNLVRIGASVGSAVAPDNGRNVQALLARSDGALYDAKRAGRGIHLADAGLAG